MLHHSHIGFQLKETVSGIADYKVNHINNYKITLFKPRG